MKLIRELVTEDVQHLIEETNSGEKNHYIKGIFLQSDIKNRNGRLYPESVMDNEVTRYIRESVDNKCAWGELNHPQGFTINLDKVSHRIVELTKDGKNWIGKAILTNTPNGNIAKGLMECGGKLGVSSRALGSLKMNTEGANIVQKDFRLSTAGDIVGDPSAPGAWVDGIMEGVEYFYDEATGLYQVAEIAKAQLSKMTIKQINENKLNMFNSFLNSIK